MRETGRGTVLVVDDEPGVLSGIRALLRREPCEVVTAQGATAAFGILATQPVDVIVTDERMPLLLTVHRRLGEPLR